MTAQWQALCASGVASETVDLAVNASKSLSYTGAAKCLLFAKDGIYKFELWGAQGGDYNSSGRGGYGGYVSGEANITKHDAFYVYVGGTTNTYSKATFNGGDASQGGATDIRLSYNSSWDNALSLNSRIMVAGGGGYFYPAVSGWSKAGSAGGLTAYNGSNTTGGSQTTAGRNNGTSVSAYSAIFGVGGSGYGGGGGYYGGGGGLNSISAGGSSYISGHTGSVAIAEGSTSEPRVVKKSGCTTGTSDNDCSIHYSGKFFSDTVMIDGAGYSWTNTKGSLQAMPNPSGGNYASGVGHSGNGYARITRLRGYDGTMQDFSCSSLSSGSATDLLDTRDNNIYTVKKLADGKCWMTQNLRIIDKTISNIDSNLLEGEGYVIPKSKQAGFNTDDTNQAFIHTYSGYYSFLTATAGWGTTNNTTGNSPKDICPKGWRLPTGGSGGEFETLVESYRGANNNITANAMINSDPSFTLFGYIYGGALTNYNEKAMYWSSSIYDANKASYIAVSTSLAAPNYAISKQYGLAIRCIAK